MHSINAFKARLRHPLSGLSGMGINLMDGLIAHWKMNEVAPALQQDSKNGYHVTSRQSTNAAGKIGNAASYDGAGADGLGDGVFFDGPSNFSIAMWVWLGAKAGDMYFIEKPFSYRMYYDFATDRFTFQVHGDVFNMLVRDTLSPSTGVWYFLVATCDVNGTITIRRNNAAVQIDPGPNEPFVEIDPMNFGGSINRYLTGMLDSISIWNRVLSGAEKDALYNAGAGLDYPFS